MMQRLVRSLCFCILLAGAAFAQINSPNFRYVAIDFPGAFFTDATGINNFGEIVGFYAQGTNCFAGSVSDSCPAHGFKLVNKVFTTIHISGALHTRISGVNDGGDVVGTFETSAHVVHGFLLHHTGQLQIIDPPSPMSGTPQGVNNSLVVVGGDFRWQNGKFTAIDFAAPNTGESQVLNGISNPGVIVGTLFRGDVLHGLVKAGGDVDIFQINGQDTLVNGVNGRGDLVGTGPVGNGGYVTFHFEANETNDKPERPPNPIIILFPGSSETFPSSINYQQAIVGTYHNSDSLDHGFLAVH
ncbi:MAG: hypothetical protein WA738_15655 [Candidatus Angelobacter sp.]